MKKEYRKQLLRSLIFLAAFGLWTAALGFVDVQAIGPNGSQVGFATWNRWFHNFTGVHMTLYIITDWLGLVPLFLAAGFAVMGLVQWIRRKQLRLVDRSILVLGGFFLAVLGSFLFFEQVTINYRPILIDGYLEKSYPSSTTLLVMCVMPTTILQLKSRIHNSTCRRWSTRFLVTFTIFMVAGRTFSGVHWLSDIIGGALLSAGLVTMYHLLAHKMQSNSNQ